MAALDRLEQSGSVVVTNAVHVLCDADGTLHVIGLFAQSDDDRDAAAVAWFLQEMLDSHPDSIDGSLPHSVGPAGVSESFVSELRDALRSSTVCLALIVSYLDVGRVVTELRGFRGAKLVHGRLSLPALAETREPALRSAPAD
jgi:hypothetical protein